MTAARQTESALSAFAAFGCLLVFIIGATVGIPLLVHLAQLIGGK